MQTHSFLPLNGVILDRMVLAVEQVRARLARAAAALEAAKVPYAVVGGNAVAAWVARIDVAAIRNTADVDFLLQRSDLPAAQQALQAAGFIYHETLDVHIFLDGPQGTPRNAVHILFAGEKVQQDYLAPSPDMSESEVGQDFRLLSLEPLVRMKLTSYRLKDQVHLQDLLGVGLIDSSWLTRFTPELAERLQRILDNPHT